MIQPDGTKLWRLAYRFGGKQKLPAFGIYPIVLLAEARVRRDAAKQIRGNGIDPSMQRELEKQASVISFRLVAEELPPIIMSQQSFAPHRKSRRWETRLSAADRPRARTP